MTPNFDPLLMRDRVRSVRSVSWFSSLYAADQVPCAGPFLENKTADLRRYSTLQIEGTTMMWIAMLFVGLTSFALIYLFVGACERV